MPQTPEIQTFSPRLSLNTHTHIYRGKAEQKCWDTEGAALPDTGMGITWAAAWALQGSACSWAAALWEGLQERGNVHQDVRGRQCSTAALSTWKSDPPPQAFSKLWLP